MIGRGILAGALMAELAGSMLVEPPTQHPSVKPKERLPNGYDKPTKATKRNTKHRKRGKHMWHI